MAGSYLVCEAFAINRAKTQWFLFVGWSVGAILIPTGFYLKNGWKGDKETTMTVKTTTSRGRRMCYYVEKSGRVCFRKQSFRDGY